MLAPKKNIKLTRDTRLAGIGDMALQLPEEGLHTLYTFAEFLVNKYPPVEPASIEIVPIPRPEKEGVIPAIKRLSKTYPMLDKKVLFDQTSAAMSAHVLNEVSVTDSIDRLETVFRQEYEEFVKRVKHK